MHEVIGFMDAKSNRIIYVSNANIHGQEPGVTFVCLNAEAFQSIDAEFLTLMAGSDQSAGVAEVEKRFCYIPKHIEFIKPRRIGGSRMPFYFSVLRRLKQLKPDKVISRNLNLFPYITRWARRNSVELFFESHDFYGDLSGRDSSKLLRMQRLERSVLPDLTGVICLSRAQGELYEECYPDVNVIVATTGCRAPVDNDLSQYTFNLGYVGSVNQQKYDLDCVINALSLVSNKSVKLLCAGASDREIKEFTELAEKVGVADRFVIEGWLTGNALSEFFTKIDVVVVPVKPLIDKKVSSPLKVLDAFSRSKPMIATGLPAISELITNEGHGYLVNNKPEEWANSIDEIYSDFSSYQTMARACNERASELSWINRANRLLELI